MCLTLLLHSLTWKLQMDRGVLSWMCQQVNVAFIPPDVQKTRSLCTMSLTLLLLQHRHAKSHVKYKPDPSASCQTVSTTLAWITLHNRDRSGIKTKTYGHNINKSHLQCWESCQKELMTPSISFYAVSVCLSIKASALLL